MKRITDKYFVLSGPNVNPGVMKFNSRSLIDASIKRQWAQMGYAQVIGPFFIKSQAEAHFKRLASGEAYRKNPCGRKMNPSPKRITKSEAEKVIQKGKRLSRLYALALAADKAFSNAVKKQFPKVRTGDARYHSDKFNATTKKAAMKFQRIMDNYLKAMKG